MKKVEITILYCNDFDFDADISLTNVVLPFDIEILNVGGAMNIRLQEFLPLS